MKFRERKHREHGTLMDLTAMVDVVFLLIIFFLATAHLSRVTRADVNLPLQPGEGLQKTDETGVVINIMRDGSIKIEDATIGLAELRALLQREINQARGGDPLRVRVLVRADREVPAAYANQVVRVLQDLGIGLGRFATEVPR